MNPSRKPGLASNSPKFPCHILDENLPGAASQIPFPGRVSFLEHCVRIEGHADLTVNSELYYGKPSAKSNPFNRRVHLLSLSSIHFILLNELTFTLVSSRKPVHFQVSNQEIVSQISDQLSTALCEPAFRSTITSLYDLENLFALFFSPANYAQLGAVMAVLGRQFNFWLNDHYFVAQIDPKTLATSKFATGDAYLRLVTRLMDPILRIIQHYLRESVGQLQYLLDDETSVNLGELLHRYNQATRPSIVDGAKAQIPTPTKPPRKSLTRELTANPAKQTDENICKKSTISSKSLVSQVWTRSRNTIRRVKLPKLWRK